MSLFYPVIWLIAWLDIMFYVENNIPCTFLRQFDIVFSFWCRFDFSAIFCPWHSEILQCYPWSASQFSHSVMSDSLWPPWTAACQASLSFTMSWSLLKLMSIESLMPYNHLILCRPLHLLPSIFPSIRRPKYWSFSFNISPCNEHPGLISSRMDLGWISLQSKGLSRVFNTTVQKHQFFSTQLSFTVQLSHPYMTTGKTIALTRQTFFGKVMSLLFNRLVITFLPRSKRLLISWLQSPSAVILEPE